MPAAAQSYAAMRFWVSIVVEQVLQKSAPWVSVYVPAGQKMQPRPSDE